MCDSAAEHRRHKERTARSVLHSEVLPARVFSVHVFMPRSTSCQITLRFDLLYRLVFLLLSDVAALAGDGSFEGIRRSSFLDKPVVDSFGCVPQVAGS